ncbi:PAS domain S-box protein [Chondrinema litorale]|uniref:PAS domain S-box protein n=1 Tax=Chondrinema litorale TaxID=2994555 RepID=UPI002542DB64|nr:PAS domain S-box protein [Chondrinema litorale]UZR99379.1 PAS domain S-box protein [Chondrinema litorale]
MQGKFANKANNIIFSYLLPIICTALLIYQGIFSGFNVVTFVVIALIIAFSIGNFFYRKSLEQFHIDKNGQVVKLLHEKVFNSGKVKNDDINALNILEKRINQAMAFIRAIGKGDLNASFADLTEDIQDLNKDNLVGEIHSMNQKMQEIAVSERQRNWATEGIAKFSEIFRQQDKPIVEILDAFLIEFCRYIQANQASVFVYDNEGHKLQLVSTYAYNRKKFIAKEVEPGEGLIGQVYLEKSSIYLKELPTDYISITSGLGEATPSVVYIAPLKFNEKVEGVMEIAAFDEWQSFETEFIDRVSEIIGSALTTLKTAEITQKLLYQSQEKEELLKSQEEEMRQNFEELIATQEEMQRKAKEAYEQHAKLSAILDSSKNSIVTLNEQGKIETINKATVDMFGYLEDELINQPLNFIIPNIPFKSKEDFNKDESLRLIGKKADGKTFPLELWGGEATLDNRSLFSCIITDITGRVKAEEEQAMFVEQMQAQEEELKQTLEEIQASQEEVQRQSMEASEQHAKISAILNATADAIITVGPGGIIETVNTAAIKLLGYSESELLTFKLKQILPEIPFTSMEEYDNSKDDKDNILKLDAVKKDGTKFPVEVSGRKATLNNRDIFVTILHNITERQKLESEQAMYMEQMQAQEEELKQTLEEINASQEELQNQLTQTAMLNHEMDARMAVLNESTILSESDIYGNITFVNDKFCEVAQFTRKELIGQPHNIVRHPDTPKLFFKNLWSTIKAGKTFRGFLKNKKKDGSPYYVDVVISPVLDENNRPIKYVAARYVINSETYGEQMLRGQAIKMEEAEVNK